MSPDTIATVAAALLFVAGYSIYLRLRAGRRRKAMGGRLVEIMTISDYPSKQEQSVSANELFRQLEDERAKGLWGALKRSVADALRPVGGLPALRMILLMSAASGAVAALIGGKILGLPPILDGLVAISVALFVPYSYVKGKATSRRNSFLDAFPDAIDLVVRAVKAGIPTSESIATAGRELSEPLAGEFRRVAQEVAIGVPPERALSEAAERVRINDFNFFAVTLVLQRETGGNLAETLENLASLLRKRREMRLKVRALTSEGRFTSKVIGGLPIFVMLALFFLNRHYVSLLFTDPTAQIFLGIAVGLIVIGMLVMNNMISMEV